MASKETTAAGFVNVSREITGELQREFSGEVGPAFRTRGVSLPLLSCSLNRFISKELSPQASAGNVSQGKSRVNGC